ncbi:hypothetical protein PVK06_019333 [Gossypium arboreum]|uniref:Reverse transcriptase Ty1/copia-type domain-containing protein n=1 Tax=Gossypium arboreum TaxID=29729 RepID=A0ABR0PJG6_GOSAR|nr:hypothetical protein PVK06_019333 [Gossypium arboreum]
MVTRSKDGIFKPKAYVATASTMEPSNIHEFMSIPLWKDVVVDELQALTTNGTWDLARLIAQGFSQATGKDYHETFSLVIKANTVHTMLSLVVFKRWKLRHADVNNAFLNGSLADKYLTGSNVFLLVYVDDIIVTGDPNSSIELVIQSLDSQFSLNDLGELSFILGLDMEYQVSSLEDRKSTFGFFIYLGDNLIGWSSKKQGVVSRSTSKAEYKSLANATAEII